MSIMLYIDQCLYNKSAQKANMQHAHKRPFTHISAIIQKLMVDG